MAYLKTSVEKCTSVCHIKQLQCHLIVSGQFQFSYSRSKLVERCGLPPVADIPLALSMFGRIESPSPNDWNAVLRSLAASPEPRRALAWLRRAVRESSSSVDALSLSFSLKACSRSLTPPSQLHSLSLRCGLLPDRLLQTTLLDAYSKSGLLPHALRLFREMPRPDTASSNALLSALSRAGHPLRALSLFRSLPSPDAFSAVAALSACSLLASPHHAALLFSSLPPPLLRSSTPVCNAAIDMFAKCGSLPRAHAVFLAMPCPRTAITWNTMITAFALNGHARRALLLFHQMARSGTPPDDVSFLGALHACNHAGLLPDAIALFNSMPLRLRNVKHYGCLVDLLARAGRLQEAFDFIQSMPMAPDHFFWQSLLGASKTYGDVEMAEIASAKLEEMGPRRCGDYVMLSNVYAARMRWDDVGKVRQAMKDKDVRKIPGFSYIDVGGVRHSFHNGDKNHQKQREIYAKLDEIKSRIVEYGYVAETSLVLHDIGEEDKENALCHHSEKLAVAFGLISTSEGTPLQVIKNLRICGDCHNMIKIIAQVYKREIIVRDRSRFHRFKDGSCSCRDYW